MGDTTPVLSTQQFTKISDGHPGLEEKRVSLELLEKQLKSLHKALEVLVKQRLDLAGSNFNFGENLTALAAIENDTSLVNNLNVLGDIHKEIKLLHEKQVLILLIMLGKA